MLILKTNIMINKFIFALFFVNFTVLSAFSQKKLGSNLNELINFESFRVIDETSSRNQNEYKLNQFSELVKDEWDSQSFLNEYEGVTETRLVKGKSYLHKEAMDQNQLGNSVILDASIIILDDHGDRFYVGMPISILKKQYPKSYERSKKFNNDENKDLRKINLVSAVNVNGQIVPSDTGGLTFIYDNNSGKVERIYSSW